jgi:hypothetical protein
VPKTVEEDIQIDRATMTFGTMQYLKASFTLHMVFDIKMD